MSGSLRGAGPTIGVLAGWQYYWTATPLSYLNPIYRGIRQAAGDVGCNLLLGNGQWAGYTHSFTNAAADQWLSQDRSSYEGVCFWLYGNNTGGTLFVDLQDNRSPGSTTDDAERWSIDLPDTFTGWKSFQIPFGDFPRKDIGNGAPNDGLGLTEMHGYAIGGFGSVNMGAKTYCVDQVSVYGNTGNTTKTLQVTFAKGAYSVVEGAAAAITFTVNMASTQPVTVTYKTAKGHAIPDRDYTPTAGTLVFAPGETDKTFTVATLNNLKATGDRTAHAERQRPGQGRVGLPTPGSADDRRCQTPDPKLLDDFEGSHPFTTTGNVTLSTVEIAQGGAQALPGQGKYEQVMRATFNTAAGPAGFSRTYPVGQDWRDHNGLSLWYYGSNSGKRVTVELLDNRDAPRRRCAARPPPGLE